MTFLGSLSWVGGLRNANLVALSAMDVSNRIKDVWRYRTPVVSPNTTYGPANVLVPAEHNGPYWGLSAPA